MIFSLNEKPQALLACGFDVFVQFRFFSDACLTAS
jgi:hypothetical protein